VFIFVIYNITNLSIFVFVILGASKEIKLKLYFGHTLISDAVTAIGKIKQFHNRYYVPPGELASGKNMSAMYKAMKRQLLKVYSQEQGYNTLHKKPEWKNAVWSLEEKAAKMEAYHEIKISEWEEKGDIAFVPDYWLTFLLCSYPMDVYFPGKKMTLDCLVPPAEAETAAMAIVPPRPIRRAERRAAGRTTGTASAATSGPVHDLTDSDDLSNTFTFVHRRDQVVGPHDDELRALQAELEQLKGNIVLLSVVPGTHAHAVMDQLNIRLVEVIIDLSRFQQMQSAYFIAKRPRLDHGGTPLSAVRGTSVLPRGLPPTPGTSSVLPSTSAFPIDVYGFMDPNPEPLMGIPPPDHVDHRQPLQEASDDEDEDDILYSLSG